MAGEDQDGRSRGKTRMDKPKMGGWRSPRWAGGENQDGQMDKPKTDGGTSPGWPAGAAQRDSPAAAGCRRRRGSGAGAPGRRRGRRRCRGRRRRRRPRRTGRPRRSRPPGGCRGATCGCRGRSGRARRWPGSTWGHREVGTPPGGWGWGEVLARPWPPNPAQTVPSANPVLRVATERPPPAPPHPRDPPGPSTNPRARPGLSCPTHAPVSSGC